MVIISSSGMCEGGRILHHLAHNVGNKNNFIIITGFMAEGTLGRKIEEGNRFVQIFDRDHEVKAKVVSLYSLSAHGDQNDLVDMVKNSAGNLKNIFIVHGEPDQAKALKEKIMELGFGVKINTPSFGESFDLM